MRRALAGAVLAVAVAAPLVALTQIPRAREAAPAPPSTRRVAPPCSAADLRLADDPEEIFQGATGSLVGGAFFEMVGSRPCSLLDRPTVTFTGRSARVNHWRVAPLPMFDPPRVGPRSPLRALRPGERVVVGLLWSNWCDPDSAPVSGPGTPPDALLVLLPHGGGALRVPVTSAPRCDVPGSPSRIGVARFAPA